MKIFIDPGHGGTDSGAASNGLLEKLNMANCFFRSKYAAK
jgi:N-acetylmuramoyl-L-alanine amidase